MHKRWIRIWAACMLTATMAGPATANDTSAGGKKRGCRSSRQAPLRVTLAGTPAGNRLLLTARVQVQGKLPTLPVLELKLPAGAILEAGLLRERLPRAALKSLVVRHFVVRQAQQKPVSVVVRAVGSSSGARAWASYPPVTPKQVRQPQLVPIPKVNIGSISIRRAVPLKAKRRPGMPSDR